MPPPDWKFALDIFPEGWVCSAEAFWIAGWVTSPALVPVDLRVRLGDRVFLGLCGLPRADKEIDVRGRAGPPHAGFSFLLQPVAAAAEIVLEVCDQYGRWSELLRHAVTMPAGLPSPATPAVGPRSLLRLLQTHHLRPRESLRTLAEEVILAENATPLDVLPSPPFHGALEELTSDAPIQYNRLLVTGWLAHREQRVVRLTAFLDTATPLPLVYGLPRPDAGELFAGLVNVEHSRFAGHLEIPPHLPRPPALRIFAELADGRQELVFTKRLRPVIVSGADTDLPPHSMLTFARAAWAWRGVRGRTPAKYAPLLPSLRQAWRDFQALAPRPSPPQIGPPETAPARPLRVTVVTHNLNLEGAPLIAFEFARFLASQPGWTIRVLSPQDGPLRALYADAGLEAEIVDLKPVLNATSRGEFLTALDQLGAALRFGETDVIAANTMVSFWAVLLAHRREIPSILYIHESVSARRFFAPFFSPDVIAESERAFAVASRVVFSASASQKAHDRLARRDHFRVIPGWIDVARIRAYAALHDRVALRKQLGWPQDAVVFVNVGSVNVRKGQQVFVDALIQLLAADTRERPLFFAMVGATRGPDPYVDLLRHTLTEHGVDAQVQIVAAVTDAYAYYRAADIFVCSSFEEAFPRVVMEAAVFGLPVVSTNVNGIPEMLGPDDAWLVPPGDPRALATAMTAALAAHCAGDTERASRGQRTVSERFDSAVLLARHRELVSAVAAAAKS